MLQHLGTNPLLAKAWMLVMKVNRDLEIIVRRNGIEEPFVSRCEIRRMRIVELVAQLKG